MIFLRSTVACLAGVLAATTAHALTVEMTVDEVNVATIGSGAALMDDVATLPATSPVAEAIERRLGDRAGLKGADKLDLKALKAMMAERDFAHAVGRDDVRIEGETRNLIAYRAHVRATPRLLARINTGEQSGELEQMLDRIAIAYDEEIDVVTERFTALLEPIMIICLAVVVGYIVYAIVVPVLSLSQV